VNSYVPISQSINTTQIFIWINYPFIMAHVYILLNHINSPPFQKTKYFSARTTSLI